MSGLNHTLSGRPEHPAVLFLHGFMGRVEDWRDIMAELDGCYRCVAVDLPGHGSSLGLPQDCYSMEGAARSVLGVLDGVGVGRAVLVGYSMGGRLALYLGLRYPERCAGLFLESASPGLEGAEERAVRRAADEEKAARLESGSFDEFLKRWYQQPVFASLAQDEELMRHTIEVRRRNDPVELARSLRGMGAGRQPSLWNALQGLTIPALAVAGEMDPKFVGGSRRMAALAPGMRAEVVDGAGHNAHAEAADGYLDLLRGFLDNLRDPPGDRGDGSE